VTESSRYPFLVDFSRESGIPEDRLVAAFEIERAFHDAILYETDPARRRELVREVYERVHPLYGKGVERAEAIRDGAKEPLVRRLRPWIEGRSILDVGCGEGDFLRAVARRVPHGALVGIDVSQAVLPPAGHAPENVRFIAADIIDFDLGRRFDVVFSENVIEHIAPADLEAHLRSIRRALADPGRLILLAPNRLFGPSDVTRIVDCTYSNRIRAMGSHLNEMTNREAIAALRGNGFRRFRAISRIPLAAQIALERSPLLLQVTYRIRRGGRPILRRPIGIICDP